MFKRKPRQRRHRHGGGTQDDAGGWVLAHQAGAATLTHRAHSSGDPRGRAGAQPGQRRGRDPARPGWQAERRSHLFPVRSFLERPFAALPTSAAAESPPPPPTSVALKSGARQVSLPHASCRPPG